MDPTARKSDPGELLAANRQLSALNRIVTACTGSLDLQKTLETVLDEALQITGLEGGTICLLGGDQILRLAVQRSVSREIIRDLTENRIKVGDCLCGSCARDLVPLILPDREAVLSYSSREVTRREEIYFHAAYPLVAGHHCVGVLCIFTRTPEKPSPRSLQTLEIVTGQVALAIENARLYQETSRHAQAMEQAAAELREKCAELERTVTRQRETQRALQESEQRLRGIADTVTDAIILIDDSRRIVYWNRAAERMFGYASDEAGGRPIDIIVPRRYLEQHTSAFEEFLENGAGKLLGKTCEMAALRADGGEFPVELSLSAIRLNDRLHTAGIVRDITERKALENRLHQARKMEAIGTLTGGIAHDFNNILMAIAGFTSLVQIKLTREHPLNGYLENILAASDRAARLIQSLLLFSRKKGTELKPADLNQVLTGMQSLLAQMLREDIRLSLVRAPEPLPVLVDEGQIGQALLNLAANARDAMPRGGSVTISTERVRIEGATLRLDGGELEPGNYARLSFSDTGVGMDEETRRRVFEPFFTTKEVGKGTGLGLATSYGIVAQHDGMIECFSEPGMGTAFRIYLPLQQVPDASTTDPGEQGVAPVWAAGHETVLLAEDDAAARELVREILQETGYRVIEALDGEDAVAKFERHMGSIQLAILDVIMPKLNGREVYQRITGLKPELKVIFTSGYAADAFREGERPEQDFNFLAKPVAPEALLHMVRKVLDG